jgi:hypothetical protein
VGACTATVMPLVEAVRAHILRIHADDTTVPVLAKGKTRTGRRAAAIYTLIETALCRARHKAVYAARRTMPNGVVFPRIRRDWHVIGLA